MLSSTTIQGEEWIEGDALHPNDPDETDPTLLRENTIIKSYTTSRFTYPSLRVVYRQHPDAPQSSRPLIIFIHGLGGSAAQFQRLIPHLSHLASYLAIDLPGCGRSRFAPQVWEAYSFESLVEVADTIINEYRHDGKVVLLGQSMGSAICAALTSRTHPRKSRISEHVVGYIATCPPQMQLTASQSWLAKTLISLPAWVFDLAGAWGARGGSEGPGVARWVEPDAGEYIRKLQYRFNMQTRTPVWQRFIYGIMPTFENGAATLGFPTPDIWAGIDVPVLMIGGELDDLAPPANIEVLRGFIQGTGSDSPSNPVFESVVLPAPANHCSIYLPSTVESVARHITQFLESHIFEK